MTLVALALVLLLLIAAPQMQAQSESVLYNFCSQPSCTDGGNPVAALTPDGAGNFYGTTGRVGSSNGVVFELSPNGSGWNYSVLYTFCSQPGCADGDWPYGRVIFDGLGNLYGIAFYGGASGNGVVFELSPVGANWTETVLHSFAGGSGDGANPGSPPIIDAAGNLYGTTINAGPNGFGIVYELSLSGGVWTEQVLYSPGSTSGYGINPGLAMDSAGNLFGATYTTQFELSPGQGGWTPNVIHTFTGAPKDGLEPGTPVIDSAGNLYATTQFGGKKNYGTVYKLSYSKKKGWKEKILYSFKGKKDGIAPYANDGALVFDKAGNIYGTTLSGGPHDDGTVFELAVSGATYKERVLWSFDGTHGATPYDGLILDDAGNLYGTTFSGGSNGFGVAFEVTP